MSDLSPNSEFRLEIWKVDQIEEQMWEWNKGNVLQSNFRDSSTLQTQWNHVWDASNLKKNANDTQIGVCMGEDASHEDDGLKCPPLQT